MSRQFGQYVFGVGEQGIRDVAFLQNSHERACAPARSTFDRSARSTAPIYISATSPQKQSFDTGDSPWAGGLDYGRPGVGCARLNFATSPRNIELAILRIDATVKATGT